MLFTSHIATSYLLAESAKLINVNLSGNEVIVIALSGAVLDLDYLAGRLIGKRGESHHTFITHTPFGVLLLWTAFFILTGGLISLTAKVFVLASLLLHLALDEVPYVFQKLGFQEFTKTHQINWFFPFTKKIKINHQQKQVLDLTLKSKASFALEVLLTVAALYLLITSGQ